MLSCCHFLSWEPLELKGNSFVCLFINLFVCSFVHLFIHLSSVATLSWSESQGNHAHTLTQYQFYQFKPHNLFPVVSDFAHFALGI